MSILMYFHLYRLVAVTETARYVRVVILKFKIKVNFDSLMGENSGGKNWARCFHLFQHLFSFL